MEMPKTPGLEPPGPDGGAAERMRQFEEARGLEPDVGTPPEEVPEEEAAESTDRPPDEDMDETAAEETGSEGGEDGA
jgi:hypothetical protein